MAMNWGMTPAIPTMANESPSEIPNSYSLRNDALPGNLGASVTMNQDQHMSKIPSKARRRRPSSQTYTCSYMECRNRKFSDQACLSRHLREKHDPEMHYCPITTCNRHRKGFPRRLNLLAHKRRCHPNTFSHSFVDSSQVSPKDNDVIDNELLVAGGVSEVGYLEADDRLGIKLKALMDLRVELASDLDVLDREIGILEGALAIMRDDGDEQAECILEA
ncbi:hypothetical protein BKA65DRAFT_100629 [Rhexocercosporidium sp. MPI-PUGE-AT-0058]|nr:hypothetical protein BKA65DRAFT_100629 [Rhexocercosporidium sp. MPI-PUGE-AT-0058]